MTKQTRDTPTPEAPGRGGYEEARRVSTATRTRRRSRSTTATSGVPLADALTQPAAADGIWTVLAP